ncbi:MAG: DUF5916 domain-containing protein [bacterium]
MKYVFHLSVIWVLIGSTFGFGQTGEKRVYVTRRINPHPPVLDGRPEDMVWQKVEWQGEFTQRAPDDGARPSQESAFKVLYDDHNLYVLIRAFDAEPDKIVRRVTRRDGFEGDWVGIQIDSYFDHRTAFSFAVTAAGVKGDVAISNDGDDEDSNWDPVWFAKVATDSLGWTAEVRIPFSQLRFSNREEQIWGFQVSRRLFRKDERSVWQYVPRNSGGWVSFFGELHGIKGIRSARRIELLPYGVTDVRRLPREAGNPFATGRESNITGGLDAKIGVSSDLTLDVTVNPDFGQVEADPSEVNLTAFETFFSEKRPFFIEGQNILDYQLMGGDGPFSNDRLFYSRRVGRSPQHEPDLNEEEYSTQPDNTSIVAAMKLTGKTKGGWSIGLLEAVTEKETAQIDRHGERSQEVAEPLTNYLVGRVQKDYNQGNTSVGGMVTALHRDLSQSHLMFLNRAAYSGGLDFRHQWQNKTYYLNVTTAFSHIRGEREAITTAQESSRRYFQRPDADYVTLDTTRTSLSGYGGMVDVGRAGSGRVRGSAGFMWRSPGLELNDLGFLRQADRVMQWTWLGYRVNNPFSIFRRLNVNVNQWAAWNFGGESVFKGGNVNGGGQFKNHWRFWLGAGRNAAGLSTSELRGGPALRTTGRWNQWYHLSTDERRVYQVGFGGSNSWADDGGSRRHNIRFWLSLRPRNAIKLRINPFYTFNREDMQYVDTVEPEDGNPRYIFGRLHQKTLGITFRLDVSITPTLSIQYYGQPFISAGTYSQFKSTTNARAAAYEDRFYRFQDDEVRLIETDEGRQVEIVRDSQGVIDESIDTPDFNFREFRSNLVVRWEYTPGSTIFAVWSQERNGDDSIGQFSFSRGLADLFDESPTNVFLIKVSRWFSL